MSQTLATYPVDDVVEVDGLRCCGLARAVCDVAQYHPQLYERVADDFQRRGHSLAWLRTTAERLQRPGRPGPAMVLADVAGRERGGRATDTWFERLVEICLRSPLIPSVRRQHVVTDDDGRFVARVDLAIPSLRLAIEAHSRQFHVGPSRETFDEVRDNRLALVGWDVRYVGWTSATTEPVAVRLMIEQICVRRAADLGIELRRAG